MWSTLNRSIKIRNGTTFVATNKTVNRMWQKYGNEACRSHRFLSSSSSSSSSSPKPDNIKKISKPLKKRQQDGGSMYLVRAGLPLILFCGLGVWVVANGIAGKNKERDAFQGRMSKSERQAHLEEEHDDMMKKLNHIVAQDFDNTKRIERPDEILERRRQEREKRNVWYRRWGRMLLGKE